METKTLKVFKPYDKVLLTAKDPQNYGWFCAMFSHYLNGNYAFRLMGGKICNLSEYDILPYEGNEHLIGTSDAPEEPVYISTGEWVMAYMGTGVFGTSTDPSAYKMCCFRSISDDDRILVFNQCICSEPIEVAYIIPFSKFNPTDMATTVKYALVAKNGTLIKKQ